MIVLLSLVVIGLLIGQLFLFNLYKDKIKKYGDIKKGSVYVDRFFAYAKSQIIGHFWLESAHKCPMRNI